MVKRKPSKKRAASRSKRSTARRTRQRQRSIHAPAMPSPLEGPDEGGLDADLQPSGLGAETTGRMMVVDLNPSGAASMQSMLSSIANSTGLGASAATVCSSSDFGTDGVDDAQANQAEVIMLEDLGIALLNGEIDQYAAAASMAASPDDGGYVIEPEYINYSLGFDSTSTELEEGLALDDFPEADVHAELFDPDTLRTLLQLLCKLVGSGGASGSSCTGGQTVASFHRARCFRDTGDTTWGVKATNILGSNSTGSGIKVAVLDTGMELGHPDFTGRNIQHSVFVSLGQPDNTIQDVNGHGTHCIGIACGPARSNFGPRYGAAGNADIFAGKVLAHNFQTGGASGSDFGILRGIQWALTNRCEIISMSLGAPAGGPQFPQAYEQAARRALQRGSLIIAATGNGSNRPGFVAPVSRPANCPSIVGVAAVDRCLRIAPFSNGRRFTQAGAEVNLSGPGVAVHSSLPRRRGNVGSMSGTSMSTPYVAGIAAMIAEETGLRGVPLYREMRRRARALGNVNDFGNGLVRA